MGNFKHMFNIFIADLDEGLVGKGRDDTFRDSKYIKIDWWALSSTMKSNKDKEGKASVSPIDFSSPGCEKCHLVETPMNQDSGSG